jgi:undecaprenyl-diphosphatase
LTLLQSILLGIIQGLTEFLPISSSAHLVLTPYFLGWEIPNQAEFIFDVLVQIGTLIAVIVYFWRDLVGILKSFLNGLMQKRPLADPQARFGWYLIIATLPAVVAGFLFKDIVEKAFSSPLITALFLIATAVFLVTAEQLGKKVRLLEHITWLDALIVGLFQAVSLFPGISRSGSTITGGMLRHLDRRSAARFSFLMSVPVMFGAGVLAIIDLLQLPDFTAQLPTLLAGFVAALVMGYLSIRWLLRYLSRHSFYGFAVYCLIAAIITFIVALIRGG